MKLKQLEDKTYQKLKIEFDDDLLKKTDENKQEYELKVINNIKEETKNKQVLDYYHFNFKFYFYYFYNNYFL